MDPAKYQVAEHHIILLKNDFEGHSHPMLLKLGMAGIH